MKKSKKAIPVDIDEPKPKGRIDKLGIKDPDNLAKQIMTDFNQSEQTKWLWIPERNEDVKNYFGVTQNAEWPFKGASRIKSQFFRIVVDTLAGNILKSLFLPEKPIKVNPSPLNKGTTDLALQNIKYAEDLHNSLQENEYNLHQVLDKAVPTSLIESFVVLHPAYEYMTNEVYMEVTRLIPDHIDDSKDLSYDPDTDTVSQEDKVIPSLDPNNDYEANEIAGMKEVSFVVDKEECTKDGIGIKVINGYRFYMPLGSPGDTPDEKIQRAPYIVHQLFYTLKEVEDLSDQGYFENINIVRFNMIQQYNKKAKENGKPIIAATVYDRQRELITYTKLTQAGFLLDTARLEYEYVEVLKWCGKWNINGKWRNVIAWIDRNSNTLLRAEINELGIKPYFILCPFPIDETPYGESLCKIIRPIVKEIDLLMRVITNIALMKSAPPKFYDPASGFNPQAVGQYGPNSWIPAREPSRNVLIPPAPEDPQAAFQMLNFLINILERITGVNEVIQGQIAKRANTTATEIQNATARSGVRFDNIYDRFKDQLKPMFNYIHKLTLKHMPEEKEIKLMGKENAGRLVKIHKAQMMGAYEFELQGNSVITEQSLLQNALTLYNTLGQHPYLSYKPESIYYVLFNIVKALNPVAMDKILPTPEEVKQLERDRAKVQGQQEQQAVDQQQQDLSSQGQLAAQKQQMEVGNMREQMTMQIQKHQMDMQMKQMELEHKKQSNDQELKHKSELHQQKLHQMKEEADAKAKEATKHKSESNGSSK